MPYFGVLAVFWFSVARCPPPSQAEACSCTEARYCLDRGRILHYLAYNIVTSLVCSTCNYL